MTSFAEIHRPTDPSDAPPVLLVHGSNVANWMWERQVDALDDRLVVTPDLPGFGTRAPEVWPGLPAVADDLADRLAALDITTPVDVVGLSLGGIVALHLAARHPETIHSVFVTGAMVEPPGPVVRTAAKLQLPLWNAPWFWKAQAAAFGLPADSRSTYVAHGLSVSRETARRVINDVTTGGTPKGLADFPAPLLAVVGEREPQSVRDSLHAIRGAAPRAEVRLVPGMHHIWNMEDVDLFNETMRGWLDGQVHPLLLQA
ncbi:pimeloyl-ACP methyl ester carboxylesterase [Lipingzhangella halophila]|uniref:Pimeloyl-ACP methyl ester carboxylesterase n=1 Tax=Lipingzhangella halophila TaxID=1783352 RepID=A0A7W7W5J9_9ACTN|nr:alpha/beta fold hydrolase [Lipingzhangella halophila]MBB4934783.1 pimeloyl-ACP methyl ester carboxylesterase [Lipingzhangella halophila]